MKVALFGVLAETARRPVIEMETVQDVQSLRKAIREKYPAIAAYSYFVAVNRRKADDALRLQENDEIALLPPFAGG